MCVIDVIGLGVRCELCKGGVGDKAAHRHFMSVEHCCCYCVCACGRDGGGGVGVRVVGVSQKKKWYP